jgi:uncharacterized protein (TIGR00730 family)
MSKFKNKEERVQRILRSDKAYDNTEFIHSKDGRLIRMLSEYLYPEQYFRKYVVNKTILFFGSARTKPMDRLLGEIDILKKELEKADDDSAIRINEKIQHLENQKFMSQSYEDAVELSSMISEWSKKLPKEERYFVCTGGGPGMMEAANKGAFNANAESIGLNISLPFEQEPNQFIHPDLNFEFHYFFMRKFWFVYHAKAIIAMPGGFGTLDEVMEILTLKQTLKITKPLTILLYNEEFWKKLINFDYLIETGMISPKDMDLFTYVNNPDEAFEILKADLFKNEKINK